MRIPAGRMVMILSLLLAVPAASAEPDPEPRNEDLKDRDLRGLAAKVRALESVVSRLQAQMAALQGNPVLALGQYVSIDLNSVDGLKGPHVFFTGVNVHIRDGAGYTGFIPLTGLGNLVVGYNEVPVNPSAKRDGSHNLIVGPRHEYSSFAGFVAGSDNRILGGHASVTGGAHNTAGGFWSSVSGGANNTASASYGSVSGGAHNTASGAFSSVSGGPDNTASGEYSSVSGGGTNTASGSSSSVCGGAFSTASGVASSVSGGRGNRAIGDQSSVSGGQNRDVQGEFDWAAGNLFSDQ